MSLPVSDIIQTNFVTIEFFKWMFMDKDNPFS